MNIRDTVRDEYIYQQRKFEKRTFVDIGRELGITWNRVRQVYVRVDWAKNGYNADHHQKKGSDSQEMKTDEKRPQAVEELMYRMPMPVQEDCKCPRCGGELEKENQKFCAHCGQKLAWDANEQ